MYFLRNLIPCTLFFALIQSDRLGAEEKSADSKVTFSCATLEDVPFPKIFYRSDNKPTPLNLITGRRSQLYDLRGTSVLQLFTEVQDESGNLEYPLIGESSVPAGADRVMFLILPDPEKPLLKIMAIDDSLRTLPPGGFRFINFSKSPMLVDFGGKKKRVDSGAIQIITERNVKGGSFIPFVITNSKGKRVYDTRLIGNSSSRATVLILAPTDSRPVSVMFFSEFLSKAEG